MKKIFILFAMLAFGTMATAQEALSYEFVVKKDGIPAEKIYSAVVDYIATNFKAVDGDFYHDKETLTITKDVKIDYHPNGLTIICYEGWLRYKLKIQCREGRFKVVLTNFYHSNLPKNNDGCQLGLLLSEPQRLKNGRFDEKVWGELKEIAGNEVKFFQNDFEQMKINTEEDDW